MGAAGASIGTAFLATPEAVEVPAAFKERIILSDGLDTTYTSFYDLLDADPWPPGIAGRVYRNRLVREWAGREREVPSRRGDLAAAVAAARAGTRPGSRRRLYGPIGGSGQRYPPGRRSSGGNLPGSGSYAARPGLCLTPPLPPPCSTTVLPAVFLPSFPLTREGRQRGRTERPVYLCHRPAIRPPTAAPGR